SGTGRLSPCGYNNGTGTSQFLSTTRIEKNEPSAEKNPLAAPCESGLSRSADFPVRCNVRIHSCVRSDLRRPKPDVNHKTIGSCSGLESPRSGTRAKSEMRAQSTPGTSNGVSNFIREALGIRVALAPKRLQSRFFSEIAGTTSVPDF